MEGLGFSERFSQTSFSVYLLGDSQSYCRGEKYVISECKVKLLDSALVLWHSTPSVPCAPADEGGFLSVSWKVPPVKYFDFPFGSKTNLGNPVLPYLCCLQVLISPHTTSRITASTRSPIMNSTLSSVIFHSIKRVFQRPNLPPTCASYCIAIAPAAMA